MNVLGFEELADEGATITEVGDAPAVVEHGRSAPRAVWIERERNAREACGCAALILDGPFTESKELVGG